MFDWIVTATTQGFTESVAGFKSREEALEYMKNRDYTRSSYGLEYRGQ